MWQKYFPIKGKEMLVKCGEEYGFQVENGMAKSIQINGVIYHL